MLSVKGNLNPAYASLLKAALPAAQPHIARVLGAAVLAAEEEDGPEGDEIASTFTPPPEPLVLDLAAATAGYHATIERLPPTFDPDARFSAARAHRLAYPAAEVADAATDAFTRPQGSFAARSFGNAVHAFLEIVAAQLASGTAAATLAAELSSWTPRITAVLRAGGLSPNTVVQLTRDTLAALTNAAAAEAQRQGVRSLDLTSRPSREAANALYRKLGFQLRETNVYRRLIKEDELE